MKIKLLSIIEKIKDLFELGKWVLMIVLSLSTFIGFRSCKNEKQEKQNLTDILTSQVETFKTKSGKNAIHAHNWEIKYNSLEKVSGEITQENSDLRNELIEAKETIKDAEIKEKDVKNYIKMELVAKDSIETNIIFLEERCRFKIEPIKQEFLDLTFSQNENYELIGIDYESRNTIHTLINLYPSRIDNPNRKRDGKKHFPNWSLFWGYDHTVISTAKDPKSEIINIVSLEFSK